MDTVPSLDQIFASLAPEKSKARYDKCWEMFQDFLCTGQVTDATGTTDEQSTHQRQDPKILQNRSPTEEDYIKYFWYLRHTKKFKSSTLWSTYSRLNNNHQRLYGAKLQKWPRIGNQLKQFEVGYERKVAKVFTSEQILLGLQINKRTPEWILRKCAVALSYMGGLRCAELKSVKYGDITRVPDGFFVNYHHAKQKGESKANRFYIPFNFNQPSHCFASRVLEYLAMLKENIPNITDGDDLFHRPTEIGYTKQVMGKNYLAKTGHILAKELGLSNPDEYTGHCFRRSAATAASNNGANTMELKRHFGWQQESTALKYTEATDERARKMARLLTDCNTTGTNKTGLPAQVVTGPPAQVVTGPPAPVVTGPPAQVVTGPPAQVVTGPPAKVVTGPLAQVVTGPPAQVVTGPPAQVVTGPPAQIVKGPMDVMTVPLNVMTVPTDAMTVPTVTTEVLTVPTEVMKAPTELVVLEDVNQPTGISFTSEQIQQIGPNMTKKHDKRAAFNLNFDGASNFTVQIVNN